MFISTEFFKKKSLVLILIATALLYFPSLFAPPFWDDYNFIFNYEGILHTSSPFIFWDTHSDFAKAWPLAYSLFWLFYRLFAENYYLYKLVNVGVHLLNVALSYLLLRKMRFPWPLFATLLFAVHPLHVETVSWIFQLSTLLAGTFFLLSYLVFLRFLESGKKSFLALAFVFFSLSLYSKPGAALLVLLFCLQFSWTKKIQLSKIRHLWVALLAIVMVITASLWTTLKGLREGRVLESDIGRSYALAPLKDADLSLLQLLPQGDDAHLAQTVVSKILLILQTNSFYLKQFFLPLPHMFIYPQFTHRFDRQLWPLLFLALALVLFWRTWGQRDQLSRSILWGLVLYFLAIFPVSGITYITFMKYSYVSDHWAYLATLGLSVMTTSLLAKIVEKMRVSSKFIAILLSFFALGFIARTFYYSRIFNHPVVNYTHTIEHNPQTPIPYLLLGTNLYNAGKIMEAEQTMLKAYFKWPKSFEVLRLLHQIYRKEGRMKEAMDSLGEIAYLYFLGGNRALAQRLAQEVILQRPENVFAKKILENK